MKSIIYYVNFATFASWQEGYYSDLDLTDDVNKYGSIMSIMIFNPGYYRPFYAYVIDSTKIRIFIDKVHTNNPFDNTTRIKVWYKK